MGVGLAGFGVALYGMESSAPGSASSNVQTAVNTVGPMVQGFGVVAGEALAATGPVVAGATDALSEAVPQQPATDPEALPTQPLAGG